MLKEITFQQLQKHLATTFHSDNPSDILLVQEDFESLFMPTKGIKFFFSKVEGKGNNALSTAVSQTINLIPDPDKCNACALCFAMHPDYDLFNLADALENIHSVLPDDADILFGTHWNEKFKKDFVIVHIFISIDFSLCRSTNNLIYKHV